MNRIGIILFILFSCHSQKNGQELVFNIESTTYKNALKQGFERVPVDVELLEKNVNNITVGLYYSDDLQNLLEKSWRFEMVSYDLSRQFIDSIVYNNGMNYLVFPCASDTISWQFCLRDKQNRLFLGRRITLNGIDNYLEFVYHYPND